MGELLPIALGAAIGLLFGALGPRRRWVVCGIAAVAAGFVATVVSGEFRLSWAFLLIDIPLVVTAALIVRLAVIRGVRRLAPAPGTRTRRGGR